MHFGVESYETKYTTINLSVYSLVVFPSVQYWFVCLCVCSVFTSHTACTGIPTAPVSVNQYNHTLISKLKYAKFAKFKHLWTIRLLIDYILPIIPINRLWKFSDYTTLSDVAIIADNRLSIAERLRLRWSIILFNNRLSPMSPKARNLPKSLSTK